MTKQNKIITPNKFFLTLKLLKEIRALTDNEKLRYKLKAQKQVLDDILFDIDNYINGLKLIKINIQMEKVKDVKNGRYC